MPGFNAHCFPSQLTLPVGPTTWRWRNTAFCRSLLRQPVPTPTRPSAATNMARTRRLNSGCSLDQVS